MFLAVYALAFALADRIWGGDIPHGRRYSILIALGSLAGLGWFTGGRDGAIDGAVLAVAWLATRSLPFRLFGGSATAMSFGQWFGLTLRHAFLIIPAVTWLNWHRGEPMAHEASVFMAWAVFAGLLGLAYGNEKRNAVKDGRPVKPVFNAALEILRGLAFGVAVAFR